MVSLAVYLLRRSILPKGKKVNEVFEDLIHIL